VSGSVEQAPRTVPINPFRPGNGQRPLYLAGRTYEHDQFTKMVRDNTVAQNAILTGLRGTGKTVLLEELKPIAQAQNWLWAGNDLSESASLTEDRFAQRIVVDLTALLRPLVTKQDETAPVGFTGTLNITQRPITFDDLWKIYQSTPGFTDDKLKAVLTHVRSIIEQTNLKGIIFAYDEAQNLSDHAASKEYPLSILLDVFSFFQRQASKCRFMLVLTGLPTLFPKLNEARTYTERMFHVMHLQRLDDSAAHDAITMPIRLSESKMTFSKKTINTIIEMSNGYPYFLQFIGKEVFDAWIGKITVGEVPSVAMDDILKKLDLDFFAPRWARATDRQQDFMRVIATMPNAEDEFSVQDIVLASRVLLKRGFNPSHATQILQALAEKGLVYRERRAGYCFAVPLLSRFIARQNWDPTSLLGLGP
jgi:AAA ATPase domain